jgi:pyruvate,water dikinase
VRSAQSHAVWSLADAAAQKAILTGEKGAMLARMIRAGLPVPEGFVVTTEVFRSLAGGLPSVIKLKDQSPANHAALERASASARKAILAIRFPELIVEEIRAALEATGAYAVSARSSSTAEDLEEASFAGQYDSFLNIHTLDDLINRIKDVWVSFYSPHAVGYRHRHRIPFEKASMAVVVQRQIIPEAAGVLFTKDPVSAKRQYVVTAALGLGEGVVAGTVETDRYILQPSTGKVLESNIVAKTMRVEATETGGIETVTISGGDGEAPALSSRQLKGLATHGRKLVRLGKGPQDIEFAVAEGRLWILQSRAMTALEEKAVDPEEPWDAGANKRYTWQRRGGPCTRLEEELLRERFDQMRVCYEETGSSMTLNHVPHFANGYAFVRSNRHDKKTLARLHARQTRRVDAWQRKGKSYFEGALRSLIVKRLSELRVQRAASRGLPDLVEYLEACIKMAAWVQGNLHWRQGKPGGRLDWTKAFHEITGEPPIAAHIYTLAVQNRMTRLIDRIRALARVAQKDCVLKRLLLDRRFEELGSVRVRARPSGIAFWKQFRSMLRVYGQRNGSGYGASNSFLTPTWNMDWSIPLGVIATYVEQNLDRLDRIEAEAREERVRATRQMRGKLADDPKKLKRFNDGVKQAVMGVRFLEDHNYYMEQCSTGTMREAVYEVGRMLVTMDLVEGPDDAAHFSLEELRQIAADPDPQDQRAFVRERERHWAIRKQMKPPETIGKPPKAAGEQEAGEKRGLDGKVIRGDAASAGRVKGRAVVLEAGKPHPKVHPGDILVASNVGPDWTPTFAVIGGLVLDSGSLGHHAALVAREYSRRKKHRPSSRMGRPSRSTGTGDSSNLVRRI